MDSILSNALPAVVRGHSLSHALPVMMDHILFVLKLLLSGILSERVKVTDMKWELLLPALTGAGAKGWLCTS